MLYEVEKLENKTIFMCDPVHKFSFYLKNDTIVKIVELKDMVIK